MRYLPLFLTACAPSVPVHVNTSIGEKLLTCYEIQYSMPHTKYERQRYDLYDQENMVIRASSTSSLENLLVNQSMGYTIDLSAASSAVQMCKDYYLTLREG